MTKPAVIVETLTPAQVAAELQVSANTARKIMKLHRAFRVGKQLRWTRTQLERYKRAGGSTCDDAGHLRIDSSSADESGGAGDTTSPENAGRSRPGRPSGARHLRLLARSNGAELFPEIVPRTSSRSKRRSDS